MGVEIRGLDRLKGKFGKVSAAAQKGAEQAVYEIAQEVEGRAVSNLAPGMKHSTGELIGSVKHEVTTTNRTGGTTAMVWSDKKQAMFREFGTGPNGEASKKDLPPGITPVYTQKAWFIPTKDVPDLAAMYGMPVIVIQGETYYMTSGQPARPWLYPALKYVEENMAKDIVKRNVQDAIQKGLK